MLHSEHGQDYGGVMLQSLLQVATKLSVRVFLETETQENAKLYEQNLFQIVHTVKLVFHNNLSVDNIICFVFDDE